MEYIFELNIYSDNHKTVNTMVYENYNCTFCTKGAAIDQLTDGGLAMVLVEGHAQKGDHFYIYDLSNDIGSTMAFIESDPYEGEEPEQVSIWGEVKVLDVKE